MRIAITGTHGSGKTTLIDDFLASNRRYAHRQEPYWELAQRGVPFADGPSIDDLAEQLGQSAGLILASASESDIIFDRCPLDFIAYLEVLAEGRGFDWTPSGRLLQRIGASIATLDLIVFLKLSSPDEIATRIEYPKLRRAVDARLRLLLRDDALGLFGGRPRLLAIVGSRQERLARLARAVSAGEDRAGAAPGDS